MLFVRFLQLPEQENWICLFFGDAFGRFGGVWGMVGICFGRCWGHVWEIVQGYLAGVWESCGEVFRGE